MIFIGVLLLLLGLFFMSGAILDWDMFYKESNIPSFFRFLYRKGARIFGFIWGLFFLICGIVFTFGLDK
jgi:hypothetical protein